MVVGLVVRPVAIGGGHIALGALGDRILDVLALVRVPYEYLHAQIRMAVHTRGNILCMFLRKEVVPFVNSTLM